MPAERSTAPARSKAPITARQRPESEPIDGVYEAVSLREFWGFLSLASFLASMATRWTVRLLPRELQGWDRIPPNAVLLVPAFALLGLLFALAAGRKTTITGRIGFLLNAVVLGLSLVLVALIAAWRLSR